MVRSLIFSVLVVVALLKEVIVPELARLTMPPVLLVIPAIVPDPPRLRVPVLVKLASAVLMAPDPVIVIFPALLRVLIEQVPPRLSIPEAPSVKIPVPDSAVPIVRVPLLVYVPVTATFPIEVVVAPLKVWPAPLKVYPAVDTLKVVALFVKLPLMAYEVVSVSFQYAPLLSVTLPANTFARAPDKFIVPVIFVFPFTVKTREQVSVPPLLIVKEPIVELRQ